LVRRCFFFFFYPCRLVSFLGIARNPSPIVRIFLKRAEPFLRSFHSEKATLWQRVESLLFFVRRVLSIFLYEENLHCLQTRNPLFRIFKGQDFSLVNDVGCDFRALQRFFLSFFMAQPVRSSECLLSNAVRCRGPAGMFRFFEVPLFLL